MNFKQTKWHGLFASPKAVVLAGAASASMLLGFSLSNSAPAAVDQPGVADIESVVNETMGLIRSRVVDLDLGTTPGMAATVQVPIDGQLVTIDLLPHSSRADDYTISVQIEDGSLIDVAPGIERTLRGVVREKPGSRVAASLLDDGLHASIMLADGEHFWVEPIAQHVQAARPEQHVVYRAGDALCDGVCGVNAMRHHAEQLRAGDVPTPIGSPICKIARLGVDADFQYYQAFGSNVNTVENQINMIIDAVNAQYEDEVGIRHLITQIIVRTSSAANPYTTNSASTLLDQFRSHWNSNHQSVQRSVAHLFTGRSLNGSTIGIAFLGVICNNFNAYGLSQRINPFSCMTDLTSHEIGHNWNAPHCSCPNHTMNASLTCANQFAQSSINSIVNHRNTRTCLIDCPPVGPANNICSGTFIVGEGTTPFTNVGATTNGPSEDEDCTFFGDGQIQSDVYFLHTAQCDGHLTISTCGSSFVTKLAVYNVGCPSSSGTSIACDLGSCPTQLRAEVSFPVLAGQSFRIRVGGANGAQGEGLLTISCGPPPVEFCPEDINEDGVVDVSDLLLLFSAWGVCPGCAADINDDGVVDVSDLLALFAAWGDCGIP